jgi:hypothetical protein
MHAIKEWGGNDERSRRRRASFAERPIVLALAGIAAAVLLLL